MALAWLKTVTWVKVIWSIKVNVPAVVIVFLLAPHFFTLRALFAPEDPKPEAEIKIVTMARSYQPQNVKEVARWYKETVWKRDTVVVREVLAPVGFGRVGLIPLTPSGTPLIEQTKRGIAVPIATNGTVSTFEYRAPPEPDTWKVTAGALVDWTPAKVKVMPAITLHAGSNRVDASVTAGYDGQLRVIASVQIPLIRI